MYQSPSTFNIAQIMVDLTNIYTNYKSTGIWDVQRKDSKSTIIAWETFLKKEQAHNSAHKKPQGTTRRKPNGLEVSKKSERTSTI